jgi:hypothetical protein
LRDTSLFSHEPATRSAPPLSPQVSQKTELMSDFPMKHLLMNHHDYDTNQGYLVEDDQFDGAHRTDCTCVHMAIYIPWIAPKLELLGA